MDISNLSPLVPFNVIICVDMDAFYAQVEQVRLGIDPELPFAVRQWDSLIAVNYVARRAGITTFMNHWQAKQKCRDLVIAQIDTITLGKDNTLVSLTEDEKRLAEVRHDRIKEKINLDYFRQACDKIIEVFKKHCPKVEKASIDEAFLDVTAQVKEQLGKGMFKEKWKNAWPGLLAGGDHFEPNTDLEKALFLGSLLANDIRMDVYNTLKYTASAGISYNKMLAKLGSGLNKPFGQTVITPRYVTSAIKGINVKKLRNFGGKVQNLFKEKGYETLGALQSLNLKQIQEIVGDDVSAAKWVYFRCRGYDDEHVEEKTHENKTITSNKSFNVIHDIKKLAGIVELVATDLAVRCVNYYEQSGLVASSIALHYYDHSVRIWKSKSMNINLNINKRSFRKVIWAKAQEFVESLKKVIMPCFAIHLTVRNFIKADFQNYKFDLDTYVRNKAQESKKKLENMSVNSLPEASSIGNISKDNTNQLPLQLQPPQPQLQLLADQGRQVSILESNSNDSQCMLQQEDENIMEMTFEKGANVEEEEVIIPVESFICDRCFEQINVEERESHTDFHFAQDIDREVNPLKRKYRQMSAPESNENSMGSISDNSNSRSTVESVATSQRQSIQQPVLKKAKTPESVALAKADKNAEKRYTFKPIDAFFKKKTN